MNKKVNLILAVISALVYLSVIIMQFSHRLTFPPRRILS